VLFNLLPATNSYFSHNTLASDISVLVKSSQHLLFLGTFGLVYDKFDDIFFPARQNFMTLNFLKSNISMGEGREGYEKQFRLLRVGK